MKSNSGLVLAVLLATTVSFILGAIFARVFPGGDSKPLGDLLIAAVGAFAGSAAGVWIGLSVDQKRREQETQDRRVEAANIAIHNLSQIYSFSCDYRNQVLRPLVSHLDRWYEISRSEFPAPALQSFDVDRLAFLFEGPHKNLPGQLSMDFLRYQGFLHTMRRAQEINDETQARARARPDDGDPAPRSPLDNFNEATKETLIGAVDTLIDHNMKMIPSVLEVALELRSAVLALYPGRTIIYFSAPIESPSSS